MRRGKEVVKEYKGRRKDVVIKEMIGGVEVKRIGDGLFFGSEIESVVIHGGITNVGARAFGGNEKLSSVMFLGDIPPIFGRDVFTDSDNVTIFVPHGADEVYGAVTRLAGMDIVALNEDGSKPGATPEDCTCDQNLCDEEECCLDCGDCDCDDTPVLCEGCGRLPANCNCRCEGCNMRLRNCVCCGCDENLCDEGKCCLDCDDCDCTPDIGNPRIGGAYGIGNVTNNEDGMPSINCAIEILKSLVGLPNTFEDCTTGDALAAAKIMSPDTDDAPGIDDAIDILKWLVDLPSELRDTHGVVKA
jgi:hypothetical protein